MLQAPNNGGIVNIGASWTRGLAIHPVGKPNFLAVNAIT